MLLIPLLASCFVACAAVGIRDHFRAAVFEHRPRLNLATSIMEVAVPNLVVMEKAASVAAKNGADIILFNEHGIVPHRNDREVRKLLMETIPDPKRTSYNPCLTNDPALPLLHSLSCMALNNNMYVAADIGDKQPCVHEPPRCPAGKVCPLSDLYACPKDGFRIYNTVVAFDRSGLLIGRYHKLHPFFELSDVDPDVQDSAIINTEFGTFGMFVCFDSVYEEAARLKVDAVLFPTYWFDDMFFWTSVEWQQSWAIANNVTYLASNTHVPGSGSLGSGIYTPDHGALVYSFEPNGQSKLLMANVGIKSQRNIDPNPAVIAIDEAVEYPIVESGGMFPYQCYEGVSGPPANVFTDFRCQELHLEGYTKVKLLTPSGHLEACHNGFCCSLDYSAESMVEDFYLVVRNGFDSECKINYWWQQNCALVRCDPFDGEPCSVRPSRSSTVFTTVDIRAMFESDRIFPTVSMDNFRLLPKSQWSVSTVGGETRLNANVADGAPLLRAGMIGRVYGKDPPFVPGPSGNSQSLILSSCPDI